MPASQTPSQLQAKFNDTDQSASTSSQYLALIDEMLTYSHVLSETSVDLTAAATTPMFTVPSGYVLEVADVEIQGVTAMSGGTATTLKVNDGTVNLLGQSTGAVFTAGTATTLLAADVIISGNALYAPATPSVATKKRFAAGAVINAVTSGTVLTAGAVKLRLIGRLYRS